MRPRSFAVHAMVVVLFAGLGVIPEALPAAAVTPVITAPVDPAGGPKSADDVYAYLDDPGRIGEGQQAPHVDLRPYGDATTAATDVSERAATSPFVTPLNGEWRMRLFDKPGDVPAAFRTAGYDARGWPAVSVPHTLQSDFIDHPMFRNIPEEIWPDDPPRVPRDVNPTAAYLRTVDLPATWDGGRVFLRFEGVTSGWFLWVNGGYAGYDQGGYTPAEFDVTALLRPGRNTIAVQVHRWGAGSYLEDYDQWRFSGIFRDVWMYRTETSRLRDAHITTDLDASYKNAVLKAHVEVDGTASRVRATLKDDRGRTRGVAEGTDISMPVTAPDLWSADDPHLYALVLELLDAAGRRLHVTSQPVGFREVEVRDRQLLVNGHRILIKGTNRAETDPDTGRYNTRQRQRDDVFLMKSLHLNAVRTSHYPSDPYLYGLADRYGLWVDDEMEAETHAHESCPSDCLADRPEWQAAFADRFQAMVARDRNHPSVIMWDTGNEAGLGAAHQAMADWATANDPTRVLYHQSNSPDGDAPYADVAGPRYPTPARLEQRAASTDKPIVMGEYAHAMGNGLGNFADFWALARRVPNIQGGFIWDWAEQNLRQPLLTTPSPTGIQAFAVGKPGLAPGHRGQALVLSGLDDFVDVFRDRRLDLTGPLTLDAWVKPGEWAGSLPIVTKGNGYALQMRDADTLEFGLDVAGWKTVAADVPAGWAGSWHHVTGVYDGSTQRLLIDGAEVASAARSGAVDPGLYEVNIGRNAETQQDGAPTRLGRALIDDVRIHSGDDLVLALDFDRFDRRGDFLSLGVSISGTDGLVGSDRYVQPETVEMAWAQAPVRFTDLGGGRYRVTNEQTAGALDLRLRWTLAEIDRTLREGDRRVRLAPGATTELSIPSVGNPADRERHLTLTAESVTDLPWAKAGWVLGRDQFSVGGRVVPGVLPGVATGSPEVTRDGDRITVSGDGWRYRFEGGTLTSMSVGGRELLTSGPALDVYRPPTSNETYGWGTADREVWHDLGLDRLTTAVTGTTVTTEGAQAVVSFAGTATGVPGLLRFDQTMRYEIDARGTITLAHDVRASGSRVSALPYLPRVGVQLRLPDRMQRFSYYGEGPEESYNDRHNGTRTGVWKSTVDDEYVKYSRPQAYGNHTGTRWATLSDGTAGLLVGGDLDVSVTPYDDLDRAEYDHQLPLVRNRGWVTLHAEAGETGMGETPNSVLTPYRVSPTARHAYELVLRPLTGREARTGVIDSTVAAPCPPDVTIVADGTVLPGTPEPVEVRVTDRCATPVTDVGVTLTAPEGWTVTPTGAKTFTVTAPERTDVGEFDLSATVTSTSAGGFVSTTTATARVVTPLPPGARWFSDLAFTEVTNGWGPIERDRSNGEQGASDGGPLTVGGTVYAKGVGAHALSRLTLDLGGACTSFRADVGVDDEMGGSGSVVFEVWADGVRRAATGVLTGNNGPQLITADLTGASTLELRVTDAGDGNGADHADWGAARLFCT
ncbi:glycoside hydrolase family 2 TIM barrel-domain containing protein [Catenuloplanes japonicus]|uniref:glycoside hydrolase family 2 TIM barrel-domain containing protein n=1 Tax=Catenuloplanes japonicus TaxID=33876 RepID=UPI000ABA2314|nr:glycoside hydrolase family 2 TIM barrel-domain containing protein [Catenuloplanes japonicus]